MKNFYEVLEVNPSDSQEKIREQYRFLVQTWHPDKYPNENDKKRANERTKEINEAYSILKSPEKRAVYDRQLSNQKLELYTPSASVIQSQPSQDLLIVVIDTANNALETLIEDLINMRVNIPYQKHLEKCLRDSYFTLFPNRMEEFFTLAPRIIDEINFILSSNNHIKKFVEKLELQNPIDKDFDWIQELNQTISSRRKQLGLPHQDDDTSASVKHTSNIKVHWKDVEPEQPQKSDLEKELEEMQERIRQRRQRNISK